MKPPRRPALAVLALGLCALTLAGCGNTLQDEPLSHKTLEGLILAHYPVYWLGGSFDGMAITAASEDPSGAFTVQYGDCVEGGQNGCVPRLRVVTSPDNSFLAVGSEPHAQVRIRGVAGIEAQAGDTLELPTGGVVLGIYADSPRLARAAAETAAPIDVPGAPATALPAALPNTGFGERPLPDQTPVLRRALR